MNDKVIVSIEKDSVYLNYFRKVKKASEKKGIFLERCFKAVPEELWKEYDALLKKKEELEDLMLSCEDA